jgi:NitT/TauT family transport system substrate-binding protein
MLPARYGKGWPDGNQARARQRTTGHGGGAGAGGRLLGGEGPAGASRLEKPVLNVAVDPGVDSAGFFIALNQGLFKDQGLTVNFIAATSGETAIAGQVAGAYDITGGNYVSYIQAQQRGSADLDIFAEGSVMGPGTQGIYTLPGSPVTTLAGLAGQTVAVSAPNSILFLLTASVLTEHGVSPASVHFASIPFTEMPAELESGAVSAAVLPEPFASDEEEAQGDVPLVDLDQGATTSFPVEGYVVTRQWAAKYPHTLAAGAARQVWDTAIAIGFALGSCRGRQR